MKKNLHCLKIFKHAFGRINKSKVLALFLVSLGIPLFAQYKKLDTNFEKLLKEKDNIAKGRKIKLPENGLTKVESKIVVTKDGAKTMYPAIVYTDNPTSLKEKGIIVESTLQNFATVLLSIEDIENLKNDPTINSIQAPLIDEIVNSVSIDQSGAGLLHNGVLNNTKYDGEGVLVGVFDTGIDFTHPDFRDPEDPTKSRIVSIWDQTLTKTGDEQSPVGFSTGVEYTRAHIEDEIDGTPTGFVRQKDINGHGTHVAGTVAGNGSGLPDKRHKGFAPKAELVIVKGGDGSFPSTNTINSISYFQKVATALNKPIVLNYSIGGQGTFKDGTASHEIAMDAFTQSGPGRVVVVAAGNDWGGNFQKDVVIQPNEEATFEINVSEQLNSEGKPNGTSISASTIFTFLGITNDKTTLTARVIDPNGLETQIPISEEITSNILNDGFLLTGLNFINTANQKRFIQIYFDRINSSSVSSIGKYTIIVKNTDSTPTTFHAYKISPAPTLNANLVNGNNKYIVSSPGNSTEAITVANYFARSHWYNNVNNTTYSVSGSAQGIEGINSSSNEGPRLDGALKPDIAASGSVVISSNSSTAPITTNTVPFVAENNYYIGKSGTSMASPGVAGATALLLQANPNLNSREVKELLSTSAFKDIATGNTANARWGHGKLDIYKAVSTTLSPVKSEFEILLLDDKLINKSALSLGTTPPPIATILTPTKTGKIGSISFSTSRNSGTVDSPITIEIRKVVDNKPTDLLASKIINNPLSELQLGSWHSIDVSDLNLQTTYGEEFAVILKATGLFSIHFEGTNISNKSLIFQNGNWQTYNRDFSIRATVYEDVSPVKVLATANRETSLTIANNKNYFVKDWENLGRIEKNEGHTIEGEVKAKVWLTNSTEHVNRVYEYTPVNNAESASAKVTLYYTQADFDQFNENKTKKLPTSPTDDAGKSNLVLYKYSGTSSDNSGARSSYTQGFTTIPLTASNILWNPTYSFWEVSFETNGFSGFIAGTDESLSTAHSKANGLQVYPNPVKEQLNINLPQGESKGQATFYDMTGRVVKTVSLNSTNDLNVSSLAKGVYLVEITTSKGVKETKKIVKQ